MPGSSHGSEKEMFDMEVMVVFQVYINGVGFWWVHEKSDNV